MLGNFKLRADLVGPYNLDDSQFSQPRASLGVDYIQSKVTFTLEAHYNGTGVPRASDYLPHLTTSPIVARGENYLLGRWYTGAATNWKISELFQFAFTVLGNVQDPSLMFASALTYQVSQDTSLALGAFQGVGKRPRIGATSEMRSEFGSSGGLYYVSLSAFL